MAVVVISVVPAKAGTQGFQLLAPLFKPGAGSGSPLSRGRRIELSQDFLTASFAGKTRSRALNAGAAESDHERAMQMARAEGGGREADSGFVDTKPLPLDDLIAVRDRGRRDRGKRLRACAEASALQGIREWL